MKQKELKNTDWIHEYVHVVPDFPKEGVDFQVYSSLLKTPEALHKLLEMWVERYSEIGYPDAIAAIDSRGFTLGILLAYRMKLPFVMVRKPGKLPNAVTSARQEMEYASTSLELEKGTVHPGQKVLIVDDVLATGGTCRAACELIEKVGAEVFEITCLLEINELHGRDKLEGYRVYTITETRPI